MTSIFIVDFKHIQLIIISCFGKAEVVSCPEMIFFKKLLFLKILQKSKENTCVMKSVYNKYQGGDLHGY